LASWQAWPDVRGIRNALEDLHAQWISHDCDWPVETRQMYSEQIHAEFGWDTIVENDWAPLLDRLTADVRNRQPAPQDASTMHRTAQVAQLPTVSMSSTNGHHEPHTERIPSAESNDLLPVAQ